jgi:DNA-binding NtrC family response regulator
VRIRHTAVTDVIAPPRPSSRINALPGISRTFDAVRHLLIAQITVELSLRAVEGVTPTNGFVNRSHYVEAKTMQKRAEQGEVRPTVIVVQRQGAPMKALQQMAAQFGFGVHVCANGRAAVRAASKAPIGMALIDLGMPGVNGLRIVERIRAVAPECAVILIGREADDDHALDAVRSGAADYWRGAWDFCRLRSAFIHVRDEIERQRIVSTLDLHIARYTEWGGMVGRSATMQETFSLLQRLALHANALWLQGEPGTEKEQAARAFHDSGPRRDRPFVVVRCTSLHRRSTEAAIETVNAWTELVAGGTVFLDDVAALGMKAQEALAATLGILSTAAWASRQRAWGVVAASASDVAESVAAGTFDAQLYERLNAIRIEMPPLRTRREDIPASVAWLMHEGARQAACDASDGGARTGRRRHAAPAGISSGAERLLLQSAWPGNFSALRRVVARGCGAARGRLITAQDLCGDLRGNRDSLDSFDRLDNLDSLARLDRLDRLARDTERDHIVSVLDTVGGNRVAAARMLGISRRALYRRIERLGISAPAARPAASAVRAQASATCRVVSGARAVVSDHARRGRSDL